MKKRLYYVAAPNRIMEIDEWLTKKCQDEPQVMFWNKVLQYEMLGLQVNYLFLLRYSSIRIQSC